MKYSYVLAFILSCSLATQTNAAKILSVFASPGPSQYIFASSLLKGLAERGHEVTSISVFPQKKPLKNFRDIAILENSNITEDYLTDMDGMQENSLLQTMNLFYDIGEKMCINVLENAGVKKLLSSPKEKFDLIIAEVLIDESLFGLAQHFNAPIVGISTFGTMGFMDRLVGNPSPLSYVPHVMMPYHSKMTFLERLTNLAVTTTDNLHYYFYNLPKQRAVYERYFPNAKLDFDEMLKSFSLILLNTHFSLSYPRPYVPNMIEVGGLHIKQQPDPLPQDMQEFLDKATDGAIYFSMGSNIKSKDLPPEKLAVFLNTFRSLKLKVLWKFETTNLPNKPDNVFISEWFPQPSILAHANVKAFISHGGLLSTTESIFHAKPILGIPMFGDQHTNVANAVRDGYAVTVDFQNLNEEGFKKALSEVLNNPKYASTVQKMSNHFRDQPLAPLEKAIFWVEYVLRHDGALHLRNSGLELNFWQLHSLDTAFTFFGGLVLAVALVLWILVKCICLICGGSSKNKRKEKKRN